MDIFIVTRAQILKYNMREEFPECFKVEAHKWYVVSRPSMQDAIVFLQEEGMPNTFGFNHYGEWTDIYSNESLYSEYSDFTMRPATNEELMNVFTEEAKRRGVWGRPIVTAVSKNISLSGTFSEYFDPNQNVLWSKYGRTFDNGEWATAVELTTEQRLEIIEKNLGIWRQ